VSARRSAAALFATAAGVFLADRLSKIWVEHALAGRPPIDVIPGVVSLTFTTNSGGAFSVGEHAPWLFAAASIGVSIVIVATGFRRRAALPSVALGLVLGGALGNLTDRLVRGPAVGGRVVDFIDLHVWPVFNLADAAIVVGALLLAWVSYRGGRRQETGPDPHG
jgi:signal peptidase II